MSRDYSAGKGVTGEAEKGLFCLTLIGVTEGDVVVLIVITRQMNPCHNTSACRSYVCKVTSADSACDLGAVIF